ncbi:Hypothetical_protein [Hexamita inflata]|uniref:Hypothetical_protein n=1 Tax=Hexamita inflata TaxID=28002 RepID=A0AA86Q8E9_9EUKA|nr:Hypothetical protein HINF_LOCUS40873 [Hexamita inflata]
MISSCLLYDNVLDLENEKLPPIQFTDIILKKNKKQIETEIWQPTIQHFCEGENQLMISTGNIPDFYENLTQLVDSAFVHAKQVNSSIIKFSMAEIENNQLHDVLCSKPLDNLVELQTQFSPAKLLQAYAPNYQRHFLFKLKLKQQSSVESSFCILFINFQLYDQFTVDFIDYSEHLKQNHRFLTNNLILLQLNDIFEVHTSVTHIFYYSATCKDIIPNLLYFENIFLTSVRAPLTITTQSPQLKQSLTSSQINSQFLQKSFTESKTPQSQKIKNKLNIQTENLKLDIIRMQDDLEKLIRQQPQPLDLKKLFESGKNVKELKQIFDIAETRLKLNEIPENGDKFKDLTFKKETVKMKTISNQNKSKNESKEIKNENNPKTENKMKEETPKIKIKEKDETKEGPKERQIKPKTSK